MKPIDVENRVLLVLLRAGGGALRMKSIHERVTTVDANEDMQPLEWRTVAKATHRLMTAGLVEIVDDERSSNGDMHPLYALTSTGESAAHQARVQIRNAGVIGTPKTTHDSVREAGHA
ncbi:MAG: hypothetical protein ACOC0M_00165 [Halomonas sp.]